MLEIVRERGGIFKNTNISLELKFEFLEVYYFSELSFPKDNDGSDWINDCATIFKRVTTNPI